MATGLAFSRQVIFKGKPSERVLCLTGDLDGDGSPEIIIGSRLPKAEIHWFGRSKDGKWHPHLIDDTLYTLEAGGVLADLDGDGDLDLIAGEDYSGSRIFWWECPEHLTLPWIRREIFRMPGNASHDQLVTDLDGDGRKELYFWCQGADTLFCVPVPDNPHVSPWPNVQVVATNVREKGLAATDLDGDGKMELIAGQSWYKREKSGWSRHVYAQGFVSPKLAVADFDGDGQPEIVIAEADASLNNRDFGRLAIFHAGKSITELWQAQVLHEQLLEPHSLAVADFDGDGRPDLFVGEGGLPQARDPHQPAQRLYLNLGGGQFREQIIAADLSSHEGQLINIDGKYGIVIKPYRDVSIHIPRDEDSDSIQLLLMQ